MHLDEERIERLAHDQLSGSERAAALEHIAACGDCRRLFDAARRESGEVAAMLGLLDSPAPAIDARSIAAKAQAVRRGGYWRWAAGVALAVGIAGVAYAWPGSPFRDWLHRAFDGARVGARGLKPAPPMAGLDESSAGIAVIPGDDFLIRFTDSVGFVRVMLVEGEEIAVRASVAATVFTSDENRILIDNRVTSSTFEIQIPRTAPRVEIRTADRRIFLKEGSRTTPPIQPGATEPLLLPLAPFQP